MTTPPAILEKIKLLTKLQQSPNSHESDNAKMMVERLIIKYNITAEELESIKDQKPLYGDDEKLFVTIGLCPWRQRLALAVGKHFECFVVQEELVPLEGIHQFTYYVYGEPEDVGSVQFVYHSFDKKIVQLVDKKCLGRGPVYISSYCEGLAEAISTNIQWEGIDLPETKVPSRQVSTEKVLNNGKSNLTVHKEEKEKPIQESVDVNSQSLIKDIGAYFTGLADGKNLSLQDILELEAENEQLAQLK